MANSDQKAKHFFFMKFFSFQDSRNPQDVFDERFLSERLALAKKKLQAIEAKTSETSELIFVMRDKFFEDPKYGFIFSALQDSVKVPIQFIKSSEQSQFVAPAKKIKHFIFMRFFPKQDPKYPHDVLDVDFLWKQLILAKNALGSLENQTNKNFELVFLANPKFFDDPKYEFVFSILRASTTLPLTFIKMGDIPRLVKDAYEKYDYVIQSRMDFDDFIYKDAVADTQSKVDECKSIMTYGYCRGYEYTFKELYRFFHPYGKIGWHGVLGSLILESSFAKKMPFIGIYGFASNHGRIKLIIKEFLEKKKVEFSESMFQQNVTTNALIYFRHDSSHQFLTKNAGNPQLKIPKRPPLTGKDITKKQLEEEFGFHWELNSIK